MCKPTQHTCGGPFCSSGKQIAALKEALRKRGIEVGDLNRRLNEKHKRAREAEFKVAELERALAKIVDNA